MLKSLSYFISNTCCCCMMYMMQDFLHIEIKPREMKEFFRRKFVINYNT
jgi:hypothetical protein